MYEEIDKQERGTIPEKMKSDKKDNRYKEV